MLVTAFICYRNGKSKKSPEHYLEKFSHLAKTGLPILLFLDRSMEGLVNYPNVRVEYTTVDDLYLTNWILQQDRQPEYVEPGIYGSSEYFVIQNSKTEFMMRATELLPDERFEWIDFGISHIFSGNESFLNKLSLAQRIEPDLVVPGYHIFPNDSLRDLHWRFIGGFFSGNRKGLTYFHDHQVRAFKAVYPTVTFEVNTWSWAEIHQNFRPEWYRANFGVHIFDFDRFIS